MTTNRELKRKLKDITSGMYYSLKDNETTFNNAEDRVVEEVMALIAAHNKQLHQALLSGLPERNDMKHAVNAHSDAGAGHVIGFNYCLDQVTKLIDKVFNKEPGL